MFYFGVVEDREDPKQMGRVRVRVMGLHSQVKTELPTDSLPWATVMMPTTSPSVSGVGHNSFLVTGSWVVVMFMDSNYQDPMIIGSIPGYPEQKLASNKGFADPTGGYPKWLNDSDVSYSAREEKWESSDPYLTKQLLRHDTDVQTALPPKVSSVANDKSNDYYTEKPWNEPPVSNGHMPIYPFNHVYETEEGHVQEFDDTLGNRRYHRFHPSGTFEEIYDDGSRLIKVIGQNYTMYMDGQNMYVEGDLNVTVSGDMRQLVEGNYHLQVGGDHTINVTGSIQQKVGGNVETEILKSRATNIGQDDLLTVMVDQNVNIIGSKMDNITVDYDITTSGNFDSSAFGTMSHYSSQNMSVTTGAQLTTTAAGNIVTETPANVNETFGGNQTTQITGNLDVDAARIDLN